MRKGAASSTKRRRSRRSRRSGSEATPKSERQRDATFACGAFGVLLGAALLFSLSTDFPLERSGGIETLRLAALLFAGGLLLRPTQPLRFAALGLVLAVALFAEMPAINNHGLLIFFIAVTAVAVYADLAVRGPRRRPRPAAYYETLAPVLRAVVAVLYFWAVVQKLNTGFFNPDVSCAAMELGTLRRHAVFGVGLDFLPGGPWTRTPAIYGTLIIETAIPTLLLIRRTRMFGVALGVGFHLVLGVSYPAFSALLFAVFSVFLPPAFWGGVRRLAEGVAATSRVFEMARRIWLALGQAYPLAAVAVLGVFLFAGDSWSVHVSGDWKRSVWFVYGLTCLGLLAVLALRTQEAFGDREVFATRIPRLLWIVPILLFANGLGPHVGFKSTLSFAMSSNLRTAEGRTNHLFLPASLQIWDHGRDLVEIEDSSDPVLRWLSRATWLGAPNNVTFTSSIKRSPEIDEQPPPRWRLPYVSLRQRVARLAGQGETNIRVAYRRGGERFQITRAEEDPELSRVPYLLNKALRLRAVPDREEGLCMW